MCMCKQTATQTVDSHVAPVVFCVVLDVLQANQAAFYVPQYLQSAGVEVVPVPVFFPDVTHILGQPVYRRVQDVPGVLIPLL